MAYESLSEPGKMATYDIHQKNALSVIHSNFGGRMYDW